MRVRLPPRRNHSERRRCTTSPLLGPPSCIALCSHGRRFDQPVLEGADTSAIEVLALQEEPVVFINGQPFVLRESARPFKNMQEYTGIDAERLESMEARLKVRRCC